VTTAERAKDKRLQQTYKKSLEEYNAQLESQKNACALCRRAFSQYQSYNDHDHECCGVRKKSYLNRFCGKCNRALLCFLCNHHYVPTIEAMLKDGVDPQKVVDYVIHWRNEIKLKGGYAQKEAKKKPCGKQACIRQRTAAHAESRPPLVKTEPRSKPQSIRKGSGRKPVQAEPGGVLG
jgi:hypothetical protein